MENSLFEQANSFKNEIQSKLKNITKFQKYLDKAKEEGLVEIQMKLVLNAETTEEDFEVVKTKEVYNYSTESSADVKINEIKERPGFIGVKKKFKQGKVNKAGEELRPDIWTITAELEW